MFAQIAAILLLPTIPVYTKDAKLRKFPGHEQWATAHLDYCDKGRDQTGSGNGENFCSSYVRNYELVNIELVRGFPPVFVYRNFAPKKYIEDFLQDIKTVKARSKGSNVKLHATEILLEQKETAGVARLFNRLRNLIPAMNFEASDPWQVLIFKKDQHYAPRHDFLGFGDEQKRDALMEKLGNRFITFQITLKSPDQGGGTVFPTTGHTFYMEPGDAMMWINMDSLGDKDLTALYGDCPVEKGEKVIATLRLREHGQNLYRSVFPGGFFSYDMILRPDLEALDMTPRIVFEESRGSYCS